MTNDEDADHLDLRHRCKSFPFMMHADHAGPTHSHQLGASESSHAGGRHKGLLQVYYGLSFAAETVQDSTSTLRISGS